MSRAPARGARRRHQAKRLAEIVERLASLGTAFSQNVLADEQAYTLALESEDDLAGLPDFVRAAARGRGRRARHARQARHHALQRSSVEPFLQFSSRRDLREKAFRAWIARGDRRRQTDNKALIAEMVALRAERAKLLGYRDLRPLPARRRHGEDAGGGARPARARLEAGARGARSPTATPCRSWCARRAATSRSRLGLALLRREAAQGALRHRRGRGQAVLPARPHHRGGVLHARTSCSASRFKPRKDVPVWHPDVRAWEVHRRGRPSPRPVLRRLFRAAVQARRRLDETLRDQEKLAGDVRPLVLNVMNFNKGARQPTLLSFDDARTLFHEFGHALHGLLSDVTYPTVSGTSVLTDWVELPSQLYEHWFEQPEVLRKFARHYKTGEPIPDALLDKLLTARNFNQRLRDAGIHLLGAGRSRPASAATADGFDVGAFEHDDARPHRHAGGDRHAAPAAAFRPRVLRRRLCLGLLQLHVVGGARRRRLRGLRGDRRHLRSGDREEAARHVYRRLRARRLTSRSAAGSERMRSTTAFRGRLPTARTRWLKQRGFATALWPQSLNGLCTSRRCARTLPLREKA